jgi:hypothetical protein
MEQWSESIELYCLDCNTEIRHELEDEVVNIIERSRDNQ